MAEAEAAKRQELAQAQRANEEKVRNEKRLQSLSALSSDLQCNFNRLKPGFLNSVLPREDRQETYEKIAKTIKILVSSNGRDVVLQQLQQSGISEVDMQGITIAYARLQSHEVVESQLNNQSRQLGHMQNQLDQTEDAARDAAYNSLQSTMAAQDAAEESRRGTRAAEDAASAAKDAASAARSIYTPPSL